MQITNVVQCCTKNYVPLLLLGTSLIIGTIISRFLSFLWAVIRLSIRTIISMRSLFHGKFSLDNMRNDIFVLVARDIHILESEGSRHVIVVKTLDGEYLLHFGRVCSIRPQE